MNALLGSLLGFALGIGVTIFIGRQLSLITFKSISAGHPAAAKIAGELAASSCWAHAGLLDNAGQTEAAELLVLASRGANMSPEEHLFATKKLQDHLHATYDQAHFQGDLIFPREAPTVLDCPEHGHSLWSGHVQCTRCLRIYGDPEGDDSPAPATCACGYRLLPEYREELTLPSSGGRACRHCAVGVPEIREVAPPDPDEQARPLSHLFEPRAHFCGHCESCGVNMFLGFEDGREIRVPPPAVCPACGHDVADLAEGASPEATETEQSTTPEED